jgi:protein SCO1/2
MPDSNPNRPSGGGRSVFIVFGSVLAVVLIVLIGVLITEESGDDSGQAGKGGLPVIGTVPDDIAVTERSGRTMTLGELDGTPWVASFIFTRCRGICPLLSRSLSKLQDDLRGMAGVKLVSFTVDPQHDTLPVLNEYAGKYNADPKRWLFFRADSTVMQTLAHDTFHVAIAEGMDESEPIVHSSKFFLIDSNGDVRGFYDGRSDKGVNQLKAALRTMVETGG